MKGVMSFVFISFTASTWQRWMSALGLGTTLLGVLHPDRVVNSFPLQAICFMGAGALFVGSALMPTIFSKLAQSRAIHSLPVGRLKLLVGALLTTAIVTLPLPVISVMISRDMYSSVVANPDLTTLQAIQQFGKYPILWNLIANVFLFCTFMYVVLWFLTTSRTVLGKTLTMLVAVVLLVVPPKFTSLNPDAQIMPVVIAIAVFWLGFSAFVLLSPRLRLKGDTPSVRVAGVIRTLWSWRPTTTYTVDTSLALLLGIGNPWILALAIILCIAIDTLFVSTLSAWLVFLAILAIVSSAIAGLATTRSRALWLRKPWSRAELFVHIEVLLWKQNAISLSVLLVTFVVIGSYVGTMAILALGLPLIVLSAAASLYLSLLQTRGLRWLESILAIATTLIIMATAVLAARNDVAWSVAMSLLVILALATSIFRALALCRWSTLDWALCRPLRLAQES